MKKIIFKQQKEVQEGDIVEIKGVTLKVNKFVIMKNPEYFEITEEQLAKMYPSEWELASKKEYLLQEAKKKYPIGTKFISPSSGKESVSNGIFRWNRDSVFSNQMCVYYRGKWAEIVPNKKYILTTEDGVDKYEGDMMYAVNKKTLNFFKDKCYFGDGPNHFYYFEYLNKAEEFIKEEKERREEEDNIKNIFDALDEVDLGISRAGAKCISKKYKITKR
jgi:hypothetical protein